MERRIIDKGPTKKQVVEVASEASEINAGAQAKDWKVQAQAHLSNYPSAPLAALWTILNDNSLYNMGLAMAIIKDRVCGLECQSRACIFEDRLQWATPIILAASASRPDLIEALVAAGANVNAVGNLNMTALHYAAENSIEQKNLLLFKHLCFVPFVVVTAV